MMSCLLLASTPTGCGPTSPPRSCWNGSPFVGVKGFGPWRFPGTPTALPDCRTAIPIAGDVHLLVVVGSLFFRNAGRRVVGPVTGVFEDLQPGLGVKALAGGAVQDYNAGRKRAAPVGF